MSNKYQVKSKGEGEAKSKTYGNDSKGKIKIIRVFIKISI